jgi:hypothetical protein
MNTAEFQANFDFLYFLVTLPMLFVFSRVLLHEPARHHHLMIAAEAFEPEICSDSYYLPLAAPAGMRLFELHDISDFEFVHYNLLVRIKCIKKEKDRGSD